MIFQYNLSNTFKKIEVQNPLSSKNQQKKIEDLEAQLADLQNQINNEKSRYSNEPKENQQGMVNESNYNSQPQGVNDNVNGVNTAEQVSTIAPVAGQDLESLKNPMPKLRSLFKWKSLARPFVKRDRNYFVKVAFGIIVAIMLAAFLQDLVLILVLCSIMFAVYVLGTIKPNEVEHEITTRGFRTLDRTYTWDELNQFWFTIKHGFVMLNITTKVRFPTKLSVVVNQGEELKLLPILVNYLDYLNVDKQGTLNKATDGRFLKLITEGEKYYLQELLSRNDISKGKQAFKEEVNMG